jgi:hypothetical protein
VDLITAPRGMSRSLGPTSPAPDPPKGSGMSSPKRPAKRGSRRKPFLSLPGGSGGAGASPRRTPGMHNKNALCTTLGSFGSRPWTPGSVPELGADPWLARSSPSLLGADLKVPGNGLGILGTGLAAAPQCPRWHPASWTSPPLLESPRLYGAKWEICSERSMDGRGSRRTSHLRKPEQTHQGQLPKTMTIAESLKAPWEPCCSRSSAP